MLNPRHLLIDGRRTLLAQEDDDATRVVQYTAREMLDCFSTEEIATLSRGECVEQPSMIGLIRYTDMVACTLLALKSQC